MQRHDGYAMQHGTTGPVLQCLGFRGVRGGRGPHESDEGVDQVSTYLVDRWRLRFLAGRLFNGVVVGNGDPTTGLANDGGMLLPTCL